MDWRLKEYAQEATETAAGLQLFLSEVPQLARDITGDIAELYAISNALHTLHEDLDLSRFGRYTSRILRDLEVCLPSLGYTLDDVRSIFFPGTPPYAQIWEDALAEMTNQGLGLPQRLEYYRTYLQGMQDKLKRYICFSLEGSV
jgi:hypothetical protein